MVEGNETSVVLQQLQDGGVAELIKLFEEQRPSLRKMLRRNASEQLAARFDPSDIIQDAFIRAESQLNKYLQSPRIHPNVWIRILCRQLLYEQTRNHFRDCRSPLKEVGLAEGEPVVDLLADSTASAGSKLAAKETRAQLLSQIKALEVLDGEIIQMRHGDCMTFREIAEILEMKCDTVKKRYYRALAKLRERAIEDAL
ncbi:MAG: RNA polymerase sigma factor [Aureliella sp.]